MPCKLSKGFSFYHLGSEELACKLRDSANLPGQPAVAATCQYDACGVTERQIGFVVDDDCRPASHLVELAIRVHEVSAHPALVFVNHYRPFVNEECSVSCTSVPPVTSASQCHM